MPSGAKKRKAAKKKKELQQANPLSHNTNTHNSLRGEEDLKHESDSEGGSPASQDHQNHHNQFTEGDGKKQFDVSHDLSIDENKSNGCKHENEEVEIVGRKDGDLVQVDGESENQKTKSYTGGLQRSSSSGSSSSSSSVEKCVVADYNNIVVTYSPSVEIVKDNDPLPDRQVTNSLLGTASTSDFDKAAIPEDVVHLTESASDANNVTSFAVGPVVQEQGEEKIFAVVEKDSTSDTVMENCKEIFGVVVDKTTVSEVLVETRLGKREAAASASLFECAAVLNGNAVANTDAKASAMLENEEKKIELPHDAPTIDVGVSVDNVKYSLVRECHDYQLTAALPSRPLEKTSWKGCCGLFELFAGSNR